MRAKGNKHNDITVKTGFTLASTLSSFFSFFFRSPDTIYFFQLEKKRIFFFSGWKMLSHNSFTQTVLCYVGRVN